MELGLGVLSGLPAWYWFAIVVCLGALIFTTYREEIDIISSGVVVCSVYYVTKDVSWNDIDILKTLSFIGIYIVIGLLWSFKKWFSFVRESYVYHTDRDKRCGEVTDFEIEVTDHKEKISVWILYWPFSVIGYLLSDFVNHITTKFRGIYNYLTEKAKGK